MLFAALIAGALSIPLPNMTTQVQNSGTDAQFRGMCVVSDRVCWVSGSKGTFALTTDGQNWTSHRVAGMDQMQFRSIVAFDAHRATMLAIGPGDQSRIVQTEDGGQTWSTRFVNSNAKAFFDAIAFWDPKHGIGFSDPVDGKIPVIVTEDGGKTWTLLSTDKAPSALTGEGAFSASGTCIVLSDSRRAWIATGGSRVSRVFRSSDRGQTWQVAETPIEAGTDAAGIFGLRFRDGRFGVAVGGDYKEPGKSTANLAFTFDGGETWTLGVKQFRGLRECASFVGKTGIIAVGPEGVDYSPDQGNTWAAVGSLPGGLHTCGVQKHVGWAAGDKGAIVRFDFPNGS